MTSCVPHVLFCTHKLSYGFQMEWRAQFQHQCWSKISLLIQYFKWWGSGEFCPSPQAGECLGPDLGQCAQNHLLISKPPPRAYYSSKDSSDRDQDGGCHSSVELVVISFQCLSQFYISALSGWKIAQELFLSNVPLTASIFSCCWSYNPIC